MSSVDTQNPDTQNTTTNPVSTDLAPVMKKPSHKPKPKRFNYKMRNNLKGITNGDIRRLARQGGVKRMKPAVCDEMRDALKDFLTSVVGKAVTIMEYGRRRTVTEADILIALKHEGVTLYR